MPSDIDGAYEKSLPPLLSKEDFKEAVVYISVLGITVALVSSVSTIFVVLASLIALVPVLGMMMLGNLYRRRKWRKEHR